MNREDIERMARAAKGHAYTNRYTPGETAFAFSIDRLERFVEMVAAAEREACATFLERGVDLGGLAEHPGWQRYSADLLTGCAAAIRARGQA